MKKTVEQIVKETEDYILEIGEGGFIENDYSIDDIPFLFGKLINEGILPEGPYVQITSEGADNYSLTKTKFLIFNKDDEFVTYLKESAVLEEATHSNGFLNLTKQGFTLLVEAYLKGM